jgi:hypothetical protein
MKVVGFNGVLDAGLRRNSHLGRGNVAKKLVEI